LAACLAIARRFAQGHGPASADELSAVVRLPAAWIEELLDRLITASIVCPVANGTNCCYTLARPADQIRVTELLEILDARRHAVATAGPTTQSVADELRNRNQRAWGDATLADISANLCPPPPVRSQPG